jgi:tetratricopeptide (TPR) repeat protein
MKLEAEYTHVWSLIWNKLKFFGSKPGLPGQLDPPARALWIEAFNSPTPRIFILEFFPIIAAAALGAFFGLKKRIDRAGTRLVLILAALFFAAYLGIERMGLVANLFIALLAAGLGLDKTRTRPRRIAGVLVLTAVLAFNFYQGFRIHDTTGYDQTLSGIFGPEPPELPSWRVNNLDLVNYVRHELSSTARFLARYSVGPMLYAYAGQAIALQPKFEVRGSRERVAEYYRGIYGSEEDLYQLCRRWRIEFFLCDLRILLDNGRDSDRWVADRLEIGKDRAVFLLHFAPESLRHFELVYQNSNYRLYRVLDPDETPGPRVFPPSAVYDLKEYGGQMIDDQPFDDQWNMAVGNRIRRAFRLVERGQKLLGSEPSAARRALLDARELYPNLIGEATVLGTAEVLLGRVKEGLELCCREVADHPYFALARYNLAYALYRSDEYEAARTELDRCLLLDPGFEPAREMRRELDAPD